MALTEARVAELYLAFFDRAPDAEGLAWWVQSDYGIEEIAARFLDSDEARALGLDAEKDSDYISALYRHLFNRDAEPEGLAYWTERLAQGEDTRQSVALAIVDGARNEDAITLENKIEAGLYYAHMGLDDVFPLDSVTQDPSSVTEAKETIDTLASTVSGTVVDGYVKGATVFSDTNGNGVLDSGEPNTTTDDNGNFTLEGATGPLIAQGGYDVSTGLPLEGIFTAPEGAQVVSPLTTLIQQMVENDPTLTAEQAAQTLAKALQLPEGVDPLTFDAVEAAESNNAENAVATQAVAAQVMTVISQTAAALDGAGAADEASGSLAAASALADLLTQEETVNLSDPDLLKEVVVQSAQKTDADPDILAKVDNAAGEIAETIAHVNQTLETIAETSGDAADLFQEIAAAQKAAETIENAIEQGTQEGDLSAALDASNPENFEQSVEEAIESVAPPGDEVPETETNDPGETPENGGETDDNTDDGGTEENTDSEGGGYTPPPTPADTTPPAATLQYSIDGGTTWHDTLAVKGGETLLIQATFSEAIDETSGATVAIDNGILNPSPMTRVDATHYTYTFEVPDNVAMETATVSITEAKDSAGNVINTPPAHATFVIDNTPPAAPTVALAHDTGDSDTDGITSDGTVNVTLSDAADSWQYTTDDGTTWHDGSGTSFLLPEGTYGSGNIYVREIDAAGNVSPLAGLGAVTVDTTPPDAPTVALANDTGLSNSDGISSDGTVNVTLSDAADSWEYSVDGGATWEEGSGTSFTLAEGDYAAGTVLAREFDDAGNASTPADLGATLIDQTAPAAPTITGLTPETDTGLSDSDNITNNLRPSVQGEAEAGSTVQLSSDGDIIGTAEADSDGHWVIEIDTSLSDGITTVEAMAVDRAGNLSDPSEALDIQVDTAPPAAPTVALANDTGESSDDGITNDGTMNVTLSSDTAYWQYSYDEGATWQDGNGNSFVLPEGEYDWGTIRVKAFDAAGNAVTTHFGDIKVDTTAATPTPALALDTGLSNSDGITQNGLIGVTLGDPDDSWEYSIDGGNTWNTGDSTTNAFLLPEGSYDVGTVLVKESDAAGNVSAPVALDRAVTVDTTAPTVTGFSAELDGLHFVSNEDGAAMLLTTVDSPESAVASVNVTADTATILDAPTQAAVTSTGMTVYDMAGNYVVPGFVILPTEGDDLMDGTDLDEIFYARGGTDTLSGGAGTDTFVVTDGSQAWLSDLVGGETLLVGVGATATIQNGGLDYPTLDLSTLARVENQGTINLIGSDGDDTIVGTDGTDCAWGGLGVDTIHTGAGDDTLLIVGVTDSDQYDETDMVCGLDPSWINGHTTSDSGSDGSGETYDGGDGTDTVQIYGNVDVSEATISGIESYVIHSSVTLPASVATSGTSFTGNGGVPGAQEGVVGFEGSGESVDLSGATFSNLSQLSIGTGLDATMDPGQLTGMGAIAVEGDATEQGSLSGISASDLGGMYVYGLGSIGGEAINDPNSAFYDPANGVMPLNTIVEGLHAMVDGTNAVLSSFSMPTVDTTNLTVEALQLMMGDLQNDNTLAGNDGIDLIVTGDGNDTIDAGNGLNFVASGKGDDTITGGAQSDFVAADLDVTPDNYGNLMTALQNNDYSVLMGDANGGNDVIATGEGDDFILPGSGSDQVFGDYGNDYIVMGQWLDSSDTIDGGGDNLNESYTDVLIVAGDYTDPGAFSGVENMEVLLLDSHDDENGNTVGSQVVLDDSVAGTFTFAIIGSQANDWIDLSGYGSQTGSPLTVDGGDGWDTIISGEGPMDLVGGAGDDTFIITDAADDANGNPVVPYIMDFARDDNGVGDSDILQVDPHAAVQVQVNTDYQAQASTWNQAGYMGVTMDTGVILIINEGVSVNMEGARATDVNGDYDNANSGYTIAAGDPLNDFWNTSPSTLIGSAAADWIIGGAGDDIIVGSAGTDILRGGPGDDIIDAYENGATVYNYDSIVFEGSASVNGIDDIYNYSGDKDMLDLSAFAGNDPSHKEDLDSATITTTDEMVYYLLGNSSGLPSDVTDTTIVADAINATATITDADATAWIVVVEDGSDGGDDRSRTAVYEWTDTADSGDGVAASELTLVALMDDYITSDLMLYVG